MLSTQRAARIMVGLFACFLALVVLAFFFQLNVISWILTRIFAPGLALALVVIFQPELRVGLAKLGSHPFFFFLRQASAGGFSG